MSSRSHSDLTVAVIHYQTPVLLEQCLVRLSSAAPKAQVIVVDTSEREPLTRQWLAQRQTSENHPVLLLSEANHSYASPVNAALRIARTPRFAQMNSDVLVEPNTFDHLATALESSSAAMAGPLARDRHGALQRNGLPYRLWQWRARRSTWTYAPWLSGCLQYLRLECALRIGGMDSSLRFYNEDLEWCLRLRAAGEHCVLVNSEVVHLGGSSTPATAAPVIEGLRGGYQLSRRYRGPLFRRAHRAALLAGSAVMSRLSEEPEKRSAYLSVADMLRRNDVDESPFGATLTSRNPRFGKGLDP